MSNTRNTTAGIAAEIAKGWQPNNYLTNMSMAYFQKPEDYVAHSIFPVCPVQLSASYYYTFSKEDLARDNVQPKPAFGKVDPAVMGQDDNTYKCHVVNTMGGRDMRRPAERVFPYRLNSMCAIMKSTIFLWLCCLANKSKIFLKFNH